MTRRILEFITNILAGFCLGLIIDYFAGTSYIFTILGTIAGIALAFILKKRKNK